MARAVPGGFPLSRTLDTVARAPVASVPLSDRFAPGKGKRQLLRQTSNYGSAPAFSTHDPWKLRRDSINPIVNSVYIGVEIAKALGASCVWLTDRLLSAVGIGRGGNSEVDASISKITVSASLPRDLPFAFRRGRRTRLSRTCFHIDFLVKSFLLFHFILSRSLLFSSLSRNSSPPPPHFYRSKISPLSYGLEPITLRGLLIESSMTVPPPASSDVPPPVRRYLWNTLRTRDVAIPPAPRQNISF